jgi:hypothetical protein
VVAYDSALGHSQTTGACLCNRLKSNRLKSQVTRAFQNASHLSQPGHTSDPSGSIVLITHLDTPDAAAHQFPIAATSASVVCRQCGNLKLLSSPTDGHLAPAPYFGSPINSATVDPFAGASVYINHRMHDLLNHCKQMPP